MNDLKKIILFSFCVCFTIIAQAQVSKTINVSAGRLYKALTSIEKTNVTNLTINDTIDARDFRFMRDSLPVLAVLDLSSVTIVGYDGIIGVEATGSPIQLPNAIPQFAFYNLIAYKGKISLKSVTLPSSVNIISIGSFEDCAGLTTVNIKSSNVSIEDWAFSGCKDLSSIDFNGEISSIGEGAFANCSNLKTFNIPSTVKSIGEFAFSNCSNIHSIYSYSYIPVDISSHYSVFQGIDKNVCILYVPVGTVGLYRNAAQWKDFVNIVEFTSTGIKLTGNKKTYIYPNPATTNFTINVTGQTMIEVYNSNGELVLNKRVYGIENIPLNDLPSGLYVVKIISNDTIDLQRLIVEK